jgi:hypothetical protein
MIPQNGGKVWRVTRGRHSSDFVELCTECKIKDATEVLGGPKMAGFQADNDFPVRIVRQAPTIAPD